MASAGTTSSSVQLLLICTCFLLSISQETKNSVAAAADSPPHPPFSFSFDFTNQSGYSSADLTFQGDAKVNGKLIDLTCDSVQPSNDSCTGAGRLSYSRPVPLHDDTTLASFNTSFTFEIKIKVNNSWPGDGMAFFLTSFPSRMPPDNPSGEYLGLLNNNDAAPYGPDQFVAVEFDTYTNGDNDDPSVNHIGIDINSVRSRNTTSLPQGQTLRGKMTATIKFDNITQTLVASLELDSYPEPIVVTYQLPDLRTFLPPEVAVGFSAATGYSTELHQILAWSFNSTLAPTIPPQGHDNNKTAMIIIGGAIGLVLLVVMAWLILSCWKWTNRHGAFENQGRKQGPTQFAYQDLAAATDNFCQERKLGQGFFGVVYSGYLKKLGCHVAVKEILNKPDVVLGPNNSHFYAELNAITLVKHKNLVNLIGWCRGNSCNFVDFMCWCWKNQNNKLFLVYELMPKGTLHDNLHKEETLPWETRYKIVKDITSALLYLHHECDPFILHRDIKPSNILLNDNFNAKLADFGLSRIVDPENNSKILTIPVGTEDYLDPQCKKPVGVVEFSRSSDVYSFGIVLLEIACGKQGSMLLREQVWQLYINRSLLQAADDKLKGELNISEMESVLILGLWCSYPDSNKKRPTMEQVMAVLEHGRPLPDLNSLDTITSSVSTQLELEMYIDPHSPTSAASSSNEQNA